MSMNANAAARTQMSAYATEYGTFIGLCWVADFFLFVWGLRTLAPLPLLAATLLIVCLPVLPCLFARRYSKQLPEDVSVGYGRAFFFCVLMMMYTCLLTAAVEFVYLRWMDHGAILSSLSGMLSSADVQMTYRQMGMTEQLRTLEDALDTVAAFSVSDIVVSLLNQNIFISLLTCLLAACFGVKRPQHSQGHAET